MCDSHKLKLRMIIIGAGLGGLGAAIGLARKGHHVMVLEAASALSEVRLILISGQGPWLNETGLLGWCWHSDPPK
jgi:monoamine oxidase